MPKIPLSSNFTDEIIMLLPYVWIHFPISSIQRINFSCHNLVTAEGLEALGECLDFKELRSLNLSDNPIKADGLAELISMFPMPHLQALNLSNTKLMHSEEGDGIEIIEFFSSFLQKLSE